MGKAFFCHKKKILMNLLKNSQMKIKFMPLSKIFFKNKKPCFELGKEKVILFKLT